MTMLEKELEVKLRKAVKACGGMCLKFICIGWDGVPDRIIILPGGRVKFVELKRPRVGRLSVRQKWWRDTFLRMGLDYSVIWNEENLETFRIIMEAGE